MTARGTGTTIQYVDRMLESVRPESERAVGRDHVRSGILDDGPNGSLGDAVQRVDVRRTRGLRDKLGVQEVLEFVRQELAGVVSVQ
jgi:hypothetical protein